MFLYYLETVLKNGINTCGTHCVCHINVDMTGCARTCFFNFRCTTLSESDGRYRKNLVSILLPRSIDTVDGNDTFSSFFYVRLRFGRADNLFYAEEKLINQPCSLKKCSSVFWKLNSS